MGVVYKIVTCSCENKIQDKKFGLQKRISKQIKTKSDTWRCTNCDKEIELSS